MTEIPLDKKSPHHSSVGKSNQEAIKTGIGKEGLGFCAG